METIGTIAFVQVQRGPMKRGEGGQRVYDPAPLLRVARLRLTWEGVIGIAETGEDIIDSHHMRHPQTRSNGTGDNSISIGFLRHYEAMRREFGEHLLDGIAGENIVVDTASGITPAMLGERVGVQRADGSVVELINVMAAPPCEPFSRFCAGGVVPASEMKWILQWLDDGTRGYYAAMPTRTASEVIAPGDRLVRLDG